MKPVETYTVKSVIDFLQLETVFGELILEDILQELPNATDIISWGVKGAKVENGEIVLDITAVVESVESPEPQQINIVGIQTPFGTITGEKDQ